MNESAYRSFVLRFWMHQGEIRRATIESVQSKEVTELHGADAQRLAKAIGCPDVTVADGDASGERAGERAGGRPERASQPAVGHKRAARATGAR